MKKIFTPLLFFIILTSVLTACGAMSDDATDETTEVLGLDISAGEEISNYDTHSGNGDGTTCIAYSFSDDTLLEEIKSSSEWKEFPLDNTVQALVYGVSDETSTKGPFLTNKDENPLVPEIQNGYYLLIDRQGENEKDILDRYSFNFTLGLYDTDTNTLYFCKLDT